MYRLTSLKELVSSLMIVLSLAGLDSDRFSGLVLTGLGAVGGPLLTDDDLIITSLTSIGC